MTLEQIEEKFKEYVPVEFSRYCAFLLIQYKVQLNVKNPRNTKSGDYRPPHGSNKNHRVTVNKDLNPYYFLLVYIHEMAHVKTWEQHKRKALPHGEEWRNNFREMAEPVVNSSLLPDDLKKALRIFFVKTPATFMADANLCKVLRKYDKESKQEEGLLHLTEIPIGTTFMLKNGQILSKDKQLRTWYLCKELATGKLYKVKGNAEIKLI